MDVTEGYAPFGEWRTWYRITGSLKGGRLPLVVAHGGPGCTHDYVDSFRDLAVDGRAVIHYDQIGNGRSSHRPDAPADFWTVELFLAELDNLLNHLGIAGRYALLGQSWGGMLGAEHAVRRPRGLKAFVIANSPSSMKVWVEEALRLRRDLPQEMQETLARHEATGDYGHPDYLAATQAFYARHVCRIQPMPPEVRRTFDQMDADPTVYRTMNGPTEFHVIGPLKDWSIVDRLPLIEVPCLLISGAFDEATPLVVKPYLDFVPDIRWHLFEHSSHMPHVEERAACMKVVGDFLATCDGIATT
ncbi:proline iminopeptidase-family hydrolase [Zavarzinia aquatilis]|uniref:Alpha/beta hydrolase n=1 Tax=Zavarzinia aquatilis TaxID=2211142 RepID=A0A317E2D4_9PROT|nr:proline iminopeptidase-family hydrolase [Zavarzinia aquatilis]PWR21248.1 alpha/beta hydrolase [Zavarzinia aquatilis]